MYSKRTAAIALLLAGCASTQEDESQLILPPRPAPPLTLAVEREKARGLAPSGLMSSPITWRDQLKQNLDFYATEAPHLTRSEALQYALSDIRFRSFEFKDSLFIELALSLSSE